MAEERIIQDKFNSQVLYLVINKGEDVDFTNSNGLMVFHNTTQIRTATRYQLPFLSEIAFRVSDGKPSDYKKIVTCYGDNLYHNYLAIEQTTGNSWATANLSFGSLLDANNVDYFNIARQNKDVIVLIAKHS